MAAFHFTLPRLATILSLLYTPKLLGKQVLPRATPSVVQINFQLQTKVCIQFCNGFVWKLYLSSNIFVLTKRNIKLDGLSQNLITVIFSFQLQMDVVFIRGPL